jgi:serine/threonine-protein kinase
MSADKPDAAQQFKRLGKFELHGLIGEGAMGVVWKAYDPVLRRFVALKRLGPQVGKTKEAHERFQREARAAAALQHPNIVTIYDLGEHEHQLFIAMELVEGRDLSELIATQEPLALERKLDIAIEMLEGLEYAHERGVIHRDIKPSNIRLTADGRVKIMDFGIARQQSADESGGAALVGTPSYMAPEQITNGPITRVTDVFAVGCLLYELLSYQKPFAGESLHGVLYQVLTTDPKPLRTMAPSIPASLERVVARAMNKVPEDRYDSARQLQQALVGIRAALSGAGDSTTQRLGEHWSRIPLWALRMLQHAPLKWRLTVLGLLSVTVAAVAYLAETSPPGPVAPAASVDTGAPRGLNPAIQVLRDSAAAARVRALRAGALRNNVPSMLVAETMWQNAEEAARRGGVTRASTGYQGAREQYAKAVTEANAMRADAAHAIERATPVVHALAGHAQALRAGAALARADSLLRAQDYTLSRITAEEAEQIGVSAGIAPPSPQPKDPQAAIRVLLQDLARAIASERVSNLRALYPSVSPTAWSRFFRSVDQLKAKFTTDHIAVHGATAAATVDALYTYVPRGGGVYQESRPRFAMTFRQTASGWRISSLRELPAPK